MPFDDNSPFDSKRSAKLFEAAVLRRRRDLDKALGLIADSRAEFMQKLEGAIAGIVEAGEAKAMLEERLRQMLERIEALRDGRIDRKSVAQAQSKDNAVLNDPALIAAIGRAIDAAGGLPRPPQEAMAQIIGRKNPDGWLEWSGLLGPTGFRAPWLRDRDDDVGTIRQGVGDDAEPMAPPPLGVCSSAPYVDDLSNVSQQAISACFTSIARSGGSVVTYANAGVGALVPGFGSASGVVFADFNLPPGYTSVTVTADFSTDVSVSAWAALAATWSVADLIMTAEHSDGSSSSKTDWVATQVAPGIWGGNQRIIGSRRVILTRSVPAAGGTLRVGAGSHSYANAPTGFMGMSESFIRSTVRSICIAAT